MHLLSCFRAKALLLILSGSLIAASVLPTAICCGAMGAMSTDARPSCCADGGHGASCPLRQAAETDPACPAMKGCHTPESLLVGLLRVAGLPPDVSSSAFADPPASPLVAAPGRNLTALVFPPLVPPPRV